MRALRLIAKLVLLLTVWGQSACMTAAAADMPLLRLGFYLPTIRDANLADVKVGLQVWADELGRSYGYRIQTSTYSELSELKEAVDREKLQMINAAGMELAEIFQLNEIQGGYAKRIRGAEEGLVLVVSQTSAIRSFADLRGKRLVRLSKDRLSDVYLETQCLKTGRVSCQDFLTLSDERRELQMAHSVFFGKTDAALLTLSALQAAGELNPQVLQRLRVIETWKTTALVFGMLTLHADPKLKKTIMETDFGSPGNPRGRQLLDLFKTDYIEPKGPEALEPYWALLQEYRALEKQGKGKRK
jgi:ABC-type phosphate/phosphonate transport system substrate-binding protein